MVGKTQTMAKKTPPKTTQKAPAKQAPKNHERRDFMVLAASATAAVGAGVAAVPLVDSLNPAADTLAMSTTEVDVSALEPGQSKKVMWQGKPIFVKRRTKEEIEEAAATALTDLPHPEADATRVQEGKEEWLVVIGICTHLGCVPLGNEGEYDGFYCPCHGSHYDVSGRIRKGPAPYNLPVPPYRFLSDTVIKIGESDVA